METPATATIDDDFGGDPDVGGSIGSDPDVGSSMGAASGTYRLFVVTAVGNAV